MSVLVPAALLACVLAGLALGGSIGRDPSAAVDRPRFARRIATLPAIVVTARDTTEARPAAHR